MSNSLRVGRSAVVAVVGGALLAGLLAGASFAPARPANIASIDLERVFNNSNLHANREADLEKTAAGFDARVGELRKKAEALNDELELFQAGSSAFIDKQAEVQAVVGELRAMDQFARVKMEAERARAMRETYEAIKVAAKAYAEANGIDFVLLDDSIPEMDPGSTQKTLQQISARRFLYANSEFDISLAILEQLNSKHPLNPGVAPPGSAKTPAGGSAAPASP
jgi:Skp family chaperone for outer membrane proteins